MIRTTGLLLTTAINYCRRNLAGKNSKYSCRDMASSQSTTDINSDLCKAAMAIKNAKALIITAGAGMGVDSGLPDFRGPQGFWKAYPPLKDMGINLSDMSNPKWFEDDPEFAWGFFGHRHNLYTKTTPHQGFQILRKWADQMELGHFVYTSNVDGHFQRSGFSEDNVVECHGSINFMQCSDPTFSDEIWPTQVSEINEVSLETLRMPAPLPVGPPSMKKEEQRLARPNILMFGDWKFMHERTSLQEKRFHNFDHKLSDGVNFVVVEIGAGTAVPTIRYTSEMLTETYKGAFLIRINPGEPHVPENIEQKSLSVAMNGLEALEKIDRLM